MKELFTSAPILKIIDPKKNFVVCIDACIEELGIVLMQEGNAIFYESCKLKYHQRNYAMHDLELTTIVHALNMWRHYLLRRMFELRMDHMNLKYLFEHLDLNARQAQ